MFCGGVETGSDETLVNGSSTGVIENNLLEL